MDKAKVIAKMINERDKANNKFWIKSLEQLQRDMGSLLLLKKAEQFGPEAGKGDDFMAGGLLMLKQFRDYLDKVKENVK